MSGEQERCSFSRPMNAAATFSTKSTQNGRLSVSHRPQLRFGESINTPAHQPRRKGQISRTFSSPLLSFHILDNPCGRVVAAQQGTVHGAWIELALRFPGKVQPFRLARGDLFAV
jgi:hypothetical protein